MPLFNGTSGPDLLIGSAGDDIINGLAGDDDLRGLDGIDELNGGDDNDILSGGTNNDVLVGGAGNDYLDGELGGDTMTGGTGNDIYFVDIAADTFIELAGEGTDTVYTSISLTLAEGSNIERLIDRFAFLDLTGSSAGEFISGNGYLSGQGGNDELIGGTANQILDGGEGNDLIDGGGGENTMIGGTGDDVFIARNAATEVVEAAGEGRDVVYFYVTSFFNNYALAAGSEIEVLSTASQSGTFAVTLSGNEFGNEVYGNDGGNVLAGNGGNDFLIGFDGNDDLSGGDGNDQLFGGDGVDVMAGGIGDDIYHVDRAEDVVSEAAGAGRDVVYASGNYALAAGSSIEVLSTISQTGTARINLSGNELANDVYGNDGINHLDGGAGSDYLLGFGGVDRFIFSSTLGAGNVDTIGDFQTGVDVIQLDFDIFRANNFGTLAAGSFVTGAAAADADDRIIYNNTTGAIFYDADGTGAMAQVQFAIVTPGITLVASDFLTI